MENSKENFPYHREHGIIILTFAFLLIPFLFFIGLCVDLAELSRNIEVIQKSADLGAASGLKKRIIMNRFVTSSTNIEDAMREIMVQTVDANLRANKIPTGNYLTEAPSASIPPPGDHNAHVVNYAGSPYTWYSWATDEAQIFVVRRVPLIFTKAIPGLGEDFGVVSKVSTAELGTVHIVLMVDVSGSMSCPVFPTTVCQCIDSLSFDYCPNLPTASKPLLKIDLLKDSIKQFIRRFNLEFNQAGIPRTTFSLVKFATRAEIVNLGTVTPANYTTKLDQAIDTLGAAGSANTNIAHAFMQGINTVTNSYDPEGRDQNIAWVLFTDGAPTASYFGFPEASIIDSTLKRNGESSWPLMNYKTRTTMHRLTEHRLISVSPPVFLDTAHLAKMIATNSNENRWGFNRTNPFTMSIALDQNEITSQENRPLKDFRTYYSFCRLNPPANNAACERNYVNAEPPIPGILFDPPAPPPPPVFGPCCQVNPTTQCPYNNTNTSHNPNCNLLGPSDPSQSDGDSWDGPTPKLSATHMIPDPPLSWQVELKQSLAAAYDPIVSNLQICVPSCGWELSLPDHDPITNYSLDGTINDLTKSPSETEDQLILFKQMYLSAIMMSDIARDFARKSHVPGITRSSRVFTIGLGPRGSLSDFYQQDEQFLEDHTRKDYLMQRIARDIVGQNVPPSIMINGEAVSTLPSGDDGYCHFLSNPAPANSPLPDPEHICGQYEPVQTAEALEHAFAQIANSILLRLIQ